MKSLSLQRLIYRSRQFFDAVHAAPPETSAAELGLTQQQYELWLAQSPADRRHTLAVWTLLRDAGQITPELLCAALLHDVAKTVPACWPDRPSAPVRRFRLWHRCAVVVLRALAPGLFIRLGKPVAPSSWRYPFYLSRHHAELGAYMAERVGCLPRTIVLIRGHTDHHAPQADSDELQAILYWADDRN